MKERKIELFAGVFVLVGLLVLAYLAVSLSGESFATGKTYFLNARFTNISGINAGSPVKVAGVSVGQVKDVVLDPEQMVAMVSFTVSADLRFDDDTIAAVRTNGLLGDRFLALLPGGSGIPLEEGDLIVDTESTVSIESLISRFAFGEAE